MSYIADEALEIIEAAIRENPTTGQAHRLVRFLPVDELPDKYRQKSGA